MELNIASNFSKTPGARYRKEGPYSGEQFREEFLLPAYQKAKEKKEKLIIILDGGYGYGSSFLEESFGGLVRSTKDKSVSQQLEIISEEEPKLVSVIFEYIRNATEEL